jgi:osmotically-inducible protein OsmY
MMRFLSLALLLSLVLTPLFAQKHVSDDALVDQVRIKLAGDADVGGSAITVEVHDAVVTLKGKVRTDKNKAKAEKIAKRVKGVASVNNQLVISPE